MTQKNATLRGPKSSTKGTYNTHWWIRGFVLWGHVKRTKNTKGQSAICELMETYKKTKIQSAFLEVMEKYKKIQSVFFGIFCIVFVFVGIFTIYKNTKTRQNKYKNIRTQFLKNAKYNIIRTKQFKHEPGSQPHVHFENQEPTCKINAKPTCRIF